jgi:hypothetical protein
MVAKGVAGMRGEARDKRRRRERAMNDEWGTRAGAQIKPFRISGSEAGTAVKRLKFCAERL